jgi:hypothetical protein
MYMSTLKGQSAGGLDGYTMWIVQVALKRPYTFIVLAFLIAIFGSLSAVRTPTDIFPQALTAGTTEQVGRDLDRMEPLRGLRIHDHRRATNRERTGAWVAALLIIAPSYGLLFPRECVTKA